VPDVIGWVVDTISGMDPTTVYVVIGVLAFLEAAAFIGLFVPGGPPCCSEAYWPRRAASRSFS
jgi:membrane protein DedA with SNARE-associated domain